MKNSELILLAIVGYIAYKTVVKPVVTLENSISDPINEVSDVFSSIISHLRGWLHI